MGKYPFNFPEIVHIRKILQICTSIHRDEKKVRLTIVELKLMYTHVPRTNYKLFEKENHMSVPFEQELININLPFTAQAASSIISLKYHTQLILYKIQ